MTKATRKVLLEVLASAICALGMALFVWGVWLAWRPGGWMVAGLFVGFPALFWLYGEARKQALSQRSGRNY